MPQIDTRSFPELASMMSRRRREANYVRSQREITPERGDAILDFWRGLSERIESEEELDNMEVILRELRGDIDMLKALQQTLSLSKDDPDNAAQLGHIIRLIQMLLDIFEQFRKRHWFLRDRALAYYMSVNPAMPSKAKDKMEAEKDGKKAGQQKSKAAVDEARKKKKEPTKKMEA